MDSSPSCRWLSVELSSSVLVALVSAVSVLEGLRFSLGNLKLNLPPDEDPAAAEDDASPAAPGTAKLTWDDDGDAKPPVTF